MKAGQTNLNVNQQVLITGIEGYNGLTGKVTHPFAFGCTKKGFIGIYLDTVTDYGNKINVHESEVSELFWFSGNYGIEFQMTKEQAESVSHPGECEPDVKELMQDEFIAKQLSEINPEQLAKELKEYGAWDEKELQDHKMNLVRIVWIAGGQITDEIFSETYVD